MWTGQCSEGARHVSVISGDYTTHVDGPPLGCPVGFMNIFGCVVKTAVGFGAVDLGHLLSEVAFASLQNLMLGIACCFPGVE